MPKNNEILNNEEKFLASNIEYLRKKKNMTQKQLGKLLGYNYTTIGNWENNLRVPNLIDLFKLSRIFNVSTDDLISKNFKIEGE